MIRLCTHCKKADTGYKEFKYCPPCFQKCIEWLERKALENPEPMSYIGKKDRGRLPKGGKRD